MWVRAELRVGGLVMHYWAAVMQREQVLIWCVCGGVITLTVGYWLSFSKEWNFKFVGFSMLLTRDVTISTVNWKLIKLMSPSQPLKSKGDWIFSPIFRVTSGRCVKREKTHRWHSMLELWRVTSNDQFRLQDFSADCAVYDSVWRLQANQSVFP